MLYLGVIILVALDLRLIIFRLLRLNPDVVDLRSKNQSFAYINIFKIY